MHKAVMWPSDQGWGTVTSKDVTLAEIDETRRLPMVVDSGADPGRLILAWHALRLSGYALVIKSKYTS